MYLVNVSYGLAGIERRFANIWRVLQCRGRFRPILVIPDTLAALLGDAGLIDPAHELVWTVPEPPWARTMARLPMTARGEMLKAFGRGWILAKAYDRVWDRIRQDPGAVVHIGLNCSSLNPADVPLVYECVDSTLTQLGTRHYIKAAARPCVVHCQSERIRVALEQELADRSPIWTTVVSPCYFAAYPPAPRIDHRASSPLVAFVGRLAAEKGAALFIEAIALVHRAGIPLRALLLGEGPEQGELQRRIADLGLQSVVDVAFDEKPLDRLLDATIFVALQTGDNYGSQSLLEAMGAGCAVVATNVGETARLVTPEVGVLVDRDAGQLADAIAGMLKNPERTRRMAAAASALVREAYSADAYVGFLESLYEQAGALHAAARARVVPA